MILRCEVCGAQIEEINEDNMAKCPYCNTVNIISRNKEKIENLFNRATFLRQNNEYKKASEIYEEILKEDNNDAAAHWGLLLCKFGIEFVYDDRTGKKTITCHKLQNNSILNDPEYLEAKKNADIEQSYVFENEAKEINNIYEKLYKISKEVEPFDIFISYKEAGDDGQRTRDSVEAQKIYNELKNNGYNVFFARKTLENHLGTEYEPVIFSALRSSKVMILIGSSEKNINSVWVKNEWSRFLELMETDSSKTIIPCYFEMSPYDMPLELSKVQSLDLTKIGFLQDLIDGINKITKGANKSSSSSTKKGEPDYLYDKAKTYEKLEDMSEARNTYQLLTKDYPGDYRGWWGLAEIDSNNFVSGYDNYNNIEGYVNRAFKLCDANKKQDLEIIWEKYFNKFHEDEYNEKLSNLERNRREVEHKIEELKKKTTVLDDHEKEKQEEIIKIENIKKEIETVSKLDKEANFQKKLGIVGGVVLVLSTAGWFLAVILDLVLRGGDDWVGGIIAAVIFSIISGVVLYGIFAVIEKVGMIFVDVKVEEDKKYLQQLRDDLKNNEQKLDNIREKIKRILDNQKELYSKKNDFNDICQQIEKIKSEGIKKYR